MEEEDDEEDERKRIGLTAVVNSSIHPDTGKPVTLPFRMSAFVPTNLL